MDKKEIQGKLKSFFKFGFPSLTYHIREQTHKEYQRLGIIELDVLQALEECSILEINLVDSENHIYSCIASGKSCNTIGTAKPFLIIYGLFQEGKISFKIKSVERVKSIDEIPITAK